MATVPALYRRHRFPPELIGHAVYLYFRFTLSYRAGEELLAVRGIIVSYETIRRWRLKFGPHFAARVRRLRPQPRGHWHLDEVHLKIGGRIYYLRRAVDTDGIVLDIFLQERRNRDAAEAFLRRLVEGQLAKPRVVVTDKLASYAPAIKAVFPRAEHRAHKGLNNRAENSHQPARQRERARRRSKSPAHTQRFLEPFGPIRDHFCVPRHLLYREVLRERFAAWEAITAAAA